MILPHFSNERCDFYILTENTHVLILKEDFWRIAPKTDPSIYGLESASSEELVKWCIEYSYLDAHSIFEMSIYETISIELFSRLNVDGWEFEIIREEFQSFFHKLK